MYDFLFILPEPTKFSEQWGIKKINTFDDLCGCVWTVGKIYEAISPKWATWLEMQSFLAPVPRYYRDKREALISVTDKWEQQAWVIRQRETFVCVGGKLFGTSATWQKTHFYNPKNIPLLPAPTNFLTSSSSRYKTVSAVLMLPYPSLINKNTRKLTHRNLPGT
jgi:hypothetical protein